MFVYIATNAPNIPNEYSLVSHRIDCLALQANTSFKFMKGVLCINSKFCVYAEFQPCCKNMSFTVR